MLSRKPYPSDVSDEEWALVAPYLTLLPEDAGQREHPCGRCPTGCGTWSATAQPRPRLQRPARNPRGPAPRRLHHPAAQARHRTRRACVTPSRLKPRYTPMPKPAERVEITTGHGRRRRDSAEGEVRLVKETRQPGMMVSAVVRLPGISQPAVRVKASHGRGWPGGGPGGGRRGR
jgi:hypothetical protein